VQVPDHAGVTGKSAFIPVPPDIVAGHRATQPQLTVVIVQGQLNSMGRNRLAAVGMQTLASITIPGIQIGIGAGQGKAEQRRGAGLQLNPLALLVAGGDGTDRLAITQGIKEVGPLQPDKRQCLALYPYLNGLDFLQFIVGTGCGQGIALGSIGPYQRMFSQLIGGPQGQTGDIARGTGNVITGTGQNSKLSQCIGTVGIDPPTVPTPFINRRITA
jgi:hypothetical protein